jgi:exosortase
MDMKKNYIKIGLLALLVAAVYLPTLIWMWDRWFAEESYYSHGILMPLVTIFLIFFKKDELSKIKPKKDNAGLILIGLALLIHLGSAWMRVYFTSGFSIILLIPGLVLYFLGREYLKACLYPILFLIFMVPMPLAFLANISVKLQLFAAQCATFILNKIGIMAARDGITIKTIHSSMEVAGACSGMKSIISLLALGSLVAYFGQSKIWKKIALLILTIPIAVCANIFRIALLTSASEIYGEKFAMGWFHSFSGFLLFAVAFLGLMVAKEIIE